MPTSKTVKETTLTTGTRKTMPSLFSALDIGASSIKCIPAGGSTVSQTRSLYVTVPAGYPRKFQGTETSPVVIYEGTTYQFGVNVSKYPALPTQALMLEDKTNSSAYVPAFLSTLRPLPDGETCYKISNLRLSVPNYDRDADKVRELFEGKRFKAVVNGLEFIADVKKVDVKPEGWGSWALAKNQGHTAKGYTLLIDIGGQTLIGLLLDETGDVLQSITKTGYGSVALARDIAQDYRLTSALDTVGEVETVIDGFLNGSNTYGNTGYSWESWMDDYTKPWAKKIIGTVMSTFPPTTLKTVGAIVFTGGSSRILRPIADGVHPLFKFLDEPETASVRGLALL